MEDRYRNCLIRVIDDDRQFLSAISFFLLSEGWKCREYQGADQFLREDDFSTPGCIITDVRMPNVNGLQLQEILIERKCRLPLIFLTGHGDLDMAVHVFRLGATDFIQKPLDTEELSAAIGRAMEANFRDAGERFSARQLYDSLSNRERQVLRDVAQYMPNKLIAEHLGIRERTVEFHRYFGLKKLGIKKIPDLVAFFQAVRQGGEESRRAEPQEDAALQ